MAFYDDMELVAQGLLKEFGKAMTLRIDNAGQTVNANTGVVTGGAPVDHPVIGVIFPAREVRLKATDVQGNEMVAYISTEELAVVPLVTHVLVSAGKSYEIKEVETLSPGGQDLMYTLTVVA